VSISNSSTLTLAIIVVSANIKGTIMSYLIDIILVARQAIKLITVAVFSPFGLLAIYLFSWQT